MADSMKRIFWRFVHLVLYPSLIIAVSFLPVSAQEEIPPELISDSIRIISPADGSVVKPGDTITVSVDIQPGSPFTHVGVVGENIGLSEAKSSRPFDFSFVIPNTLVGPKKLTAVGVIRPGEALFSRSITIHIEPGAALTALRPSLTRINFRFPGEQSRLHVDGVFSDGRVLDITGSSQITFSSQNDGIATVEGTGLVTATGTGATNIVITHSGRSITVPASVPKTIPGDLDANGKVNRDDLNILLGYLGVMVFDDWTNIPDSKSRPAVGPFDARDLNGDGVVNSDDVSIMVGLIGALADLSITLSASPNPATVGSEVTYTLTVTNNGPNPAPYVSVRGFLPKSQFVSSSIRQCGVIYDQASCNFASLDRKRSVTASIAAIPTEVGTFPGMVRVGSGVPDPVVTNDRASVQVNVLEGQPPSSSGRISGRGHIDAAGKRYEFRFDVRLTAKGEERGRLQLQVEELTSASGRGGGGQSRQTNRFVSTEISTVSFSDSSKAASAGQTQATVDAVQFSGTGEWNGKPGFVFEARATDVVKQGSGSDTFSITVKHSSGAIVAAVSGTIASGDIRTFR